MRITALLCSSLAACMPTGEGRRNGNGGVDAAGSGSSAAACDNPSTVSGDLSINGDFSSVPSSCWQLGGKLTLSGSSIASLDKLGHLTAVGSIEIANTTLAKLDSMHAIAVAGDVSIHDNTQLADISNLAPAATLASLRVDNNAALANASSLASVTTVTGAVSIQNDAKLATLDLSQLDRVEGTLTIANAPALTSLKLAALYSTGTFTVRGNSALTTLGSLAALKYVHGDLVIDSNPHLAKLSDAMTSQINSIDSSLTITNNAALVDVGQLAYAGLALSIDITSNAALPYCTAREVGCCVNHQGTAQIHNDLAQSCAAHSWCYAQYNGCPYAYTDN